VNDSLFPHARVPLPLPHRLSIERYVPELMPRHSRSDVCSGCLIQLQKYSLVGEAATTQPPLPVMLSSPATSFTQFPSLPFRFAHSCELPFVPFDPHTRTRTRNGPKYSLISWVYMLLALMSIFSLQCFNLRSRKYMAFDHWIKRSSWSLIDQLSCLDFDNGCNCNANRLKQF